MIKQVSFHVYGLLSATDLPLMVVHLEYKSSPYLTLESCSAPGTFTFHYSNYPRKVADSKIDEQFESWLFKLLGPYGEDTEKHRAKALYEHYVTLVPNQHFSADRVPKFNKSAKHRSDAKWLRQNDYLTDTQREAYANLLMGMNPWPDTAKNRRIAKAEMRRVGKGGHPGKAAYMDERSVETILSYLPETFRLNEYRLLTFILRDEVKKVTNTSALRNLSKRGNAERIHQCYEWLFAHPHVYLPPPEHLFDDVRALRVRCEAWRHTLHRFAAPYYGDYPFLPDLPCARKFWEADKLTKPSNLIGLTFDDVIEVSPKRPDWKKTK